MENAQQTYKWQLSSDLLPGKDFPFAVGRLGERKDTKEILRTASGTRRGSKLGQGVLCGQQFDSG
jgi:hypothetical protein